MGGWGGDGGGENARARKIIALNTCYYSSSTLTWRHLVDRLSSRWGRACKVGLVTRGGDVVLRIYTQEGVLMPQNAYMYEDICYRLNNWNVAARALRGIHDGALGAENTGVVDIPLHVPTTGARTSEFIFPHLGDIPEL